MNSRILVVEDEGSLAAFMSDVLESEGHSVEVVTDGPTGLQAAMKGPFDLLILDVMLPGLTGHKICKSVRERGFEGGILMLSAKDEVRDRIEGFRTGADDYLVKPFALAELAARVEALLRRTHNDGQQPVEACVFGNVVVDFTRLRLMKGGSRIRLTAKEWALLRLFVRHRGEVLSRETILRRIWVERDDVAARTVDVHIVWLRQKLEDNPHSPTHILTIRGRGYRFSF